jgi:hypothetical protein
MIELEISYAILDEHNISIIYGSIEICYADTYYIEYMQMARNIRTKKCVSVTGILLYTQMYRICNYYRLSFNLGESKIKYLMHYDYISRYAWEQYMREECTDEEIAAFEKFHNELLMMIKK